MSPYIRQSTDKLNLNALVTTGNQIKFEVWARDRLTDIPLSFRRKIPRRIPWRKIPRRKVPRRKIPRRKVPTKTKTEIPLVVDQDCDTWNPSAREIIDEYAFL